MRLASPKQTAKWISTKYAQSKKERAEALAHQATLYEQQEHWKLAIKNWKKIANTYAGFASAHTFMRIVFSYRKLGNYVEAKKVARIGVTKYPNSLALAIEYAEALTGAEDWKEAASQWRNILATFPDTASAGVHVRLATCLRNLHEYKTAENHLNKVSPSKVSKDTFESLLAEYAELSMAQGNYSQAITRWQKLLKEFDENPYVVPTSKVISARFYTSLLSRLLRPKAYRGAVSDYLAVKAKPDKKIVVFTGISGNYDSLKLPEHLDKRFDYVLFADVVTDHSGIFTVKPLPHKDKDKTKESRFVKTHAHTLLKHYDVAIWVDASIIIAGDIYPMVEEFIHSKKPMAAIPHPQRTNIYDEAEACLERGKDKASLIRRQLRRYKKEGFDGEGLIESGFMMFRPKDRKTAATLDLWWKHIRQFSKRDQLSLPYAIYKTGLQWHKLTNHPNSIRNHPQFILVPHSIDSSLVEKLAIMVAEQK